MPFYLGHRSDRIVSAFAYRSRHSVCPFFVFPLQSSCSDIMNTGPSLLPECIALYPIVDPSPNTSMCCEFPITDPNAVLNQTPYFLVLGHPSRPNFRQGLRIPQWRAEGLTFTALCDFRPSRSQKGHERRTKALRSYQRTTYRWSSFRAH